MKRKLAYVQRFLAIALAVVVTVSGMPITANASQVRGNTNIATVDETEMINLEAETSTNDISSTEEIGLLAEITPEEKSLEEAAVTDVYEIRDGIAAEDKTAVYTGTGVFDITSRKGIRAGLTLYKNGEEYAALSTNGNMLINKITYTWKDAAGEILAGEPINVGEYSLVVTLPGEEGSHEETSIAVPFTITPAELSAEASVGRLAPGTMVKDIVVDSITVKGADIEFAYIADDMTTEEDESANSEISVDINVIDIINNVTLGKEDSLVATSDYVMDITVALTEAGKEKAAGNVKETTTVRVDALVNTVIPSYVNVAFTEDWEVLKKVVYTYSGSPIEAPTEGMDYTVKVQYKSGETDENGNPVYVDITDAELVKEWYELKVVDRYEDAEGNLSQDLEWVKMEQAPVDAGNYAYRLSYAGKAGVYAASYKDILVVIEPATIIINPIVAENALFYLEMTEAEVLAQVDYEVLYADDPTKTVDDFNKETGWGVSYDDNNSTQSYEPVFVLQYQEENADENVEPAWINNSGADLSPENKYRVIFSGYKAVYSSDGYDETEYVSINENVNSKDMNYVVETDYNTALSVYTADVKVETGLQTTIDISEITAGLGGKGDSLENPYVKEYDGKSLYENAIADYKKAIVTADKEVARYTNPAISYVWYKNTNDSITDYVFSDSTNEPYGDNEVNTFDQDWSYYGTGAPADAGVYKLVITYKDKTQDEYNASTASVFYVIEKQQIKTTLGGDYKALTTTTFEAFMEDFYRSQMDTLAIEKVSDGSVSTIQGQDYRVDFMVTETTLVVKTDEGGNEVVDEDGNIVYVPQTTGKYHYCSNDDTNYKVVDADGNQIMEEVNNSYYNGDGFTFSENENVTYQLTANLVIYNDNYTDEKTVCEDIFILKDEQAQAHTVRYTEDLNEKATINVEKMGDIRLSVKIDEEKIGTTEKEYDGAAFALKELLGDGAVTVTMQTDNGTEEVSDLDLTYEWEGYKWSEADQSFLYGDWSEVSDAGSYELYVSFAGDATYAPINRTHIASVNITPKALAVTPVITEDIVAGNTVSSIWDNSIFLENLLIEGFVEADRDAFTYGYHYDSYNGTYTYGYDAWSKSMPTFRVYDEEGQRKYDYQVLKGEKNYTVIVYAGMEEQYANNYTVTYNEASFTTVRGNSTVTSHNSNLFIEHLTDEAGGKIGAVAINDEITDYTHEIRVLQAVPYSYHINTSNTGREYGNLLELNISFPAEYEGIRPSAAKFQKEIKAQGGVAWYLDDGIRAIFNLTKNNNPEFTIRWEEGYTETFRISVNPADLMGDLTEAVAPKTIAFNSPAKKMAVGEEQELDLKMTKVQMDDVVCIAYKVSDAGVLSIDKYGKITALKPGTATVTAYPTHLVNGEKVAIEGAKTASVKITVTDVTAPKIKKIQAKDDNITLQYASVTDGYRREIYVLEGKNISASVFESKIASMKNQQWQDIFVVAPLYYDSADEANMHAYNNKGVMDAKTVETDLYDLDYNTQYTIYVRNVSAFRTLEDGSEVTLSKSGTTKSFATTKPQVEDLLAGVKDVEQRSYYDNSLGKSRSYYSVNFSKGKVSLHTLGGFEECRTDEVADEGEYLYYELPLGKELQKYYVNPKLTYSVHSGYNAEDDYVYGKADLATVDKKGNVKFKGVGTVYIKVTDVNTNVFDVVELRISASADKVKGNKTKLSVGEQIRLENLLTYYEGNKKLTGSFQKLVVVDEKLINTFANDTYFDLVEDGGYYYVRAVKEGGKLDVELTDYYVQNANGTATTSVKLTSTKLTQVKSLKIANAKNLGLGNASLADTYAYVQFTYSGGAEAFRINVTDSRGKTIRSVYMDRDSMSSGRGLDYKYYYVYKIIGLTKQSKYKVEVTAIYSGIEAKTIRSSFTTTKKPVSTIRLLDYQMNAGLPVYVATDNTNVMETLNDGKYFVSNNTYTLVAGDTDWISQATGSDSLIWSSSNKKVATIKANQGSFTASFKAIKTGTTTIEIKSKITKEVVARYSVKVTSVGDGYEKGRRYYGENEPGGLDDAQTSEGIELVIDTWTYVAVNGGSEKWAKYTATVDALYTFRLNSGTGHLYDALTGEELGIGKSLTYKLKENQSVYLEVRNNGSSLSNIGVYLSRKDYKELGDNGEVILNPGIYTWTEYTAKEDGMYVFKPAGDTDISYCDIRIYENINDGAIVSELNNSGSCKCIFEMNAGDTVLIRTFIQSVAGDVTFTVDKYIPEPLTVENPVVVTEKAHDYDWITFTAPKTDYYTFEASKNDVDSDSTIGVLIYDAIGGNNLATMSGNEDAYSVSCVVNKGEKRYLKVSGNNSADEADFTLSVLPSQTVTLDTPVTAKTSVYTWMTFTAPEDGRYVFQVASDAEIDYSGIYLYKTPEAYAVKSNYNSYGKAKCLYEMKQGELIYIRTEAYGAADTYNVTVSKHVPITLSETNPVNVLLAESEYDWVMFTAPEDNYYVFTATENEGASSDATIGLYFYDAVEGTQTSSLTSWSSTYTNRYLRAGEVVYLKVSGLNYSYPADFTLTVEGLQVMSVGDVETIETKTYTWMVFTAEKTGMYAFEVSEDSQVASSHISLYEEFNGSVIIKNENTYGRAKVVYSMAQGETVYVRAYGTSEDESYKVTINEYVPGVLTEGVPITVTEEVGEYEWITFTAPKTAYYHFAATEKTEDSKAGVYVELFDELNGNQLKKIAYKVSAGWNYKINAGDTIYMKVGGTSSYTAYFDLCVERLTEIAEGDCVTVVPQTYKWMSFTASEAGMYAFEVSNTSIVTSSKIYLFNHIENVLDTTNSGSVSYGDNSSGRAKCIYDMEEGETVYIRAYGVSEEESYEVKVSRFEPIPVSEDAEITVQKDPGEYEWYSFTASADGYYIFTAEKSADSEFGMKLYLYDEIFPHYYDSTGNYIEMGTGSNNVEMVYQMEAGQTVYIRAKGEYSFVSAKYTLRVRKEKEIFVDTDMPIEPSVKTWLRFTALEAGMYAFEISDNSKVSSSSIYLYSDPKDSYIEYAANSGGRCKCLYSMEKNQTVYVKAYGVTEEETLAVRVRKYEPEVITADTIKTVQLDSGEYEWYAFTPEESGSYTYYVTENESATYYGQSIAIYDAIEGKVIVSRYSSTGNIEKYFEAEKDTTIYFGIATYDSNYSADFNIKIVKDLQMTTEKPVDISIAENENRWLVFKAQEDGYYSFCTQRTDDTSGSHFYLYEMKGEGVTDSDYSSDGLVELQYAMHAGQAVYLKVTGINPVTPIIFLFRENG